MKIQLEKSAGIISKLTDGKNGKPRREILREKLQLDFYYVYSKH